MYGIHMDPMGLYRGFMGSIGMLWVMYGIHRDPMGLHRAVYGLQGRRGSCMASVGTLWGSIGALWGL